MISLTSILPILVLGYIFRALAALNCWKQFVLFLFGCVLPSLALAARQDEPPAGKTADLLKKIEIEISARKGWDYPIFAIENPHVLKKVPEFQELQTEVHESWPAAMSNLDAVAPSPMEKTILFIAMQSSSVDDYLRFLDRACELTTNHVLDRQLLKYALFPGDKNLRGLLDATHDRSITKSILRKAQILYADDQNMARYCSAALSGETERNTRAYFDDNPQESRPPLFSEVPLEPSVNGSSKHGQNSQIVSVRPSGKMDAPVSQRQSTKLLWPLGGIVFVLSAICLWFIRRMKR
ncbi:MAG TPA: hypothetical protein VK961_22480 [Chthoniobacter sp.]|nr:hypothetical protein [Chthoniobacter sp.]